MKNKRILLVEDKYEDIISIQDSLKSLKAQHTLHVVHNIPDALQVLMGGSSHYGLENYSQTGKVRPDIVLLNISFLQDSATEFLEVMQKYYSLKNIKVYIIGDLHEALDAGLAVKYGIAGYLVKPLDLQDTLNESVLRFRQELVAPGKALFSLPFFGINNKIATTINYLKTKAAFYYFGTSAAAKVTASVAATVLVAGMLSSSTTHDVDRDGGRKDLPARLAATAIVQPVSPASCEEEPSAAIVESTGSVRHNRKAIHTAPEQAPPSRSSTLR
jgi:CheY-like chemotaxis protein